MASGPTGAAPSLRVWDWPLRLFHWLLVAAVALALLSAEEDSALNAWHVAAGWTAGILVVFRLAWGIIGGEHSRFASFVRPSGIGRHVADLVRGRAEATLGHNPLGALSVLLLLGLVAVTVWTGVTLREGLHEILGWTLLALVAVHVLAVLGMSWLTGESLVRAMITGAKPASRHPGGADARPPGWLAVAVAVALAGGAIYAVLAYDPLAFTARSTEAYEHRADAGPAREDDHLRRGDAPGDRDQEP